MLDNPGGRMSANDSPGPEWRWALPAGRVLTLTILMVFALAASAPEHRVVVGAILLVSFAGTLYGLRFGAEQWRRRLIGVLSLGAGGIALIVIDANAPGWMAAGVAIAAGLVRLPLRPSLIFAALTAAGASTVPLLRGDTRSIPVIASICGAFAVIGMILSGARTRAVTAERLLASEQAARESEQIALESAAQAERYAERQRLAREIHDILAHTLSAQAVQLESARMLLEHGRPIGDVRQHIETAQRLARDGLEETRRAVHSLRGEARPLPVALRALADTAGATYQQEGEVRPLPAQASLAIERTVQEALTNARKHAPGAKVTVTMRFYEDHDEVEILDTGGIDGDAPLASSGGGYGLAGMRERAELIGGELTTGPYPVGADGKGYRVWLTVPRSAPSAS